MPAYEQGLGSQSQQESAWLQQDSRSATCHSSRKQNGQGAFGSRSRGQWLEWENLPPAPARRDNRAPSSCGARAPRWPETRLSGLVRGRRDKACTSASTGCLPARARSGSQRKGSTSGSYIRVGETVVSSADHGMGCTKTRAAKGRRRKTSLVNIFIVKET
jgi:hypothetical protein